MPLQNLSSFLCLTKRSLPLFLAVPLLAQINVVTQHNDNLRTGQNLSETILTPANVSTGTFGKLFAVTVDGLVYAEPLYIQNVNIPGKGSHNVVFAATQHDSIYAVDADQNTGTNASPLWHITLLDAAHGAAAGATTVPNSAVSTSDIVPEIGISGTPVIDPASGTLYVVGKTMENGSAVQRLHALDITTGAEQAGSPVTIQASVAATGSGSSSGILKFDPLWEHNRPALLLQNGVLYLGFGSHGDNGPWHGWILSYSASTLKQIAAFCTSRNGFGSGIWGGGTGLAADQTDPVNHPAGRLFAATGNGSFNAAPPYTAAMNFGDDDIRFDLTGGALTITDMFTPANQQYLSDSDLDFGSGGVMLLPDQSGPNTHLMVQVGKEGTIYLVNRDNLGGYNASVDTALQKITGQIGGLWGAPAYWNGNVYFATNGDNLKAFRLTAGKLSTTPTAKSSETYGYPGSTPSVSANGVTNGIVWTVNTAAYTTGGSSILQAHDASNVASSLYSSNQNTARDDPGPAVKFSVPTVANGKVYLGAGKQLNVYGLLTAQPQAAMPVLNPPGASFNGTQMVSISEATPNASVYYTLDGSTPTQNSTLYGGSFTLTSSVTVQAAAFASGYLNSAVASGVFTLATQTPAPAISPAGGSFSSTQTVTLSDASAGASIYYTLDGSAPTTSSPKYISPLTVNTTTTIRAIAAANGLSTSPSVTAAFTIYASGAGINLSQGFSNVSGLVQFNGSTGLDDTRLQLTDGGADEAGSAFYTTALNIQSFSTDFTFQLSNPAADGFTFTIQRAGPTALGPSGGGLGFGPDQPGGTAGIRTSLAIKFDLYSNAGESADSTGLYSNGVSPTTPSIDLSQTGINLHSGDTMAVHLVYNGTTLSMTITDSVANKTYSTSWPVNIPAVIGGNTAYVGFTGGTGGLSSSQKVETWTFVSNTGTGNTGGGGTVTPVAAPLLSLATGSYSSAQSVTITDSTPNSTIHYTLDGSTPSATSASYAGALTIAATTTLKAIATATGMTASPIATAVYTITTTSTPPGGGTGGGGVTSGNAIDFSQGFAGSSGTLSLSGSSGLNGTRLQLTNGGGTESASAFYSSPVNIQTFATDFALQLSNPNADGMTFTIQGVGPKALGATGGALGYGADATAAAITKSVAVKFDLYSNSGEGINSTGLYTNGASPATPSINLAGTNIDLHSGHAMSVHLAYNGTTLSMTITDTVKQASYSTSWPVNIPSIVGGSTAYVGFTAGTGGLTATQEILTWTFGQGTPQTAAPVFTPTAGVFGAPQSVKITDATSNAAIYYTLDGSAPSANSSPYTVAIPVPSTTTLKAIAIASGLTNSPVTAGVYTISTGVTNVAFPQGFTGAQSLMTFNGTTSLSGTRLQLTNGGQNQGASAFYNSPLGVTSFTTDFNFQLTNPSADGITFTIQNVGPAALGASGGALGYGAGSVGGIAHSIAIKFDLYSNSGEGIDSTGLYQNGAQPSTPSIDLSSAGVNLHNGNTMAVHMTYDGATLTMTVTDTVLGTAFTHSWPVNIPAVIGGATGYVGFTGGTGGSTATQAITTWTYTGG